MHDTRLIERWLPIAEIGVESTRERTPMTPFLARAVVIDLDGDVVERFAKKKGSNLHLWDSAQRAAKGAIEPADGSQGMIDAVHRAAHTARTRSLQAARELLAGAQADRDPRFFAALEAVLVTPDAPVEHETLKETPGWRSVWRSAYDPTVRMSVAGKYRDAAITRCSPAGQRGLRGRTWCTRSAGSGSGPAGLAGTSSRRRASR